MAPTIIVRPPVVTDGKAMGEAHARAWEVAYVDLFSPEAMLVAAAERRARWPAVLEAGDVGNRHGDTRQILVPVLDGRVVGLAVTMIDATDPTLGEVLGFYLHPDAWGSGAAGMLMEAALALFDEPIERIHLWTHPGAERAHAFYRKAGFEATGARQTDAMIEGEPPVPEIEFARPR